MAIVGVGPDRRLVRQLRSKWASRARVATGSSYDGPVVLVQHDQALFWRDVSAQKAGSFALARDGWETPGLFVAEAFLEFCLERGYPNLRVIYAFASGEHYSYCFPVGQADCLAEKDRLAGEPGRYVPWAWWTHLPEQSLLQFRHHRDKRGWVAYLPG